MKISEFLDLKLKPGIHDLKFINQNDQEISHKLTLSDYENLEVLDVNYQMLAIVQVKEAK